MSAEIPASYHQLEGSSDLEPSRAVLPDSNAGVDECVKWSANILALHFDGKIS
jgi:hypothetical protein